MQMAGQNATAMLSVVTPYAIVVRPAHGLARMQWRGDSDAMLGLYASSKQQPAPASSRGPVICNVLREESRASVEFTYAIAYGFSTGSRTALPHSVHDPS
jgi:hypothetical protein